MKRLIVLGLIASALLLSAPSRKPSPVPSPRESIQTNSRSSNAIKPEPQNQQQPSAGARSIAQPNLAPHQQSVGAQVTDQDTSESKLVRVAPVDINRDLIDYINP